MPHFLSMIIVSYIVLAFLNMENGFVNKYVMPLFGRDAVNWYVDKKPWPFLLVFVHFWKELGFGCIIYLSSIAGIDTQLYEAAAIDGANVRQQITKITLPMLKTIIAIQLILGVGGILGGDFGLFYQVPMDSGSLSDVTTTIPVYQPSCMSGNYAHADQLRCVRSLLMVYGNNPVHASILCKVRPTCFNVAFPSGIQTASATAVKAKE